MANRDAASRQAPLICAVGDLVEDIAVRLDKPPEPNTDTPCRIHRRRGGSAANVAVAAARAGARGRFIGRVGTDAIGGALLEALQAECVDVVAERGGRTGTIVVLIGDAGDRTFLTDRAAAAELSAVDIAALDGAAVLHVPAYSLHGGAIPAATKRLVAAARSRGVPVTVDASSTAVLRSLGPAAFADWCAAHAAVAFANADEAAVLGWLDERDPPIPWVIKRGSRAATLRLPGLGALDVDALALAGVVDTTGAGDAFAGGFLAAWCGRPEAWRDAVVAGHESAAAWIRRRTREVIEEPSS